MRSYGSGQEDRSVIQRRSQVQTGCKRLHHCAICAHGLQKAATCHEGECNRDASAATKKGQAAKKGRRQHGTDVAYINNKRRRQHSTDVGTNNQKERIKDGTDAGSNNAKRRRKEGTDAGTNNAKARREQGTDAGTNNRKARAEEKKFANIKANRKAADIDISDSDIADTMGDYFVSGEPKKGATKKGQPADAFRMFRFMKTELKIP